MKKIPMSWTLIAFAVCSIFITLVVLNIKDDSIGRLVAQIESQKIIQICKERGIYSRKYPYDEICYYVRKWSDLFDLDRKMVYAIIIKESEMNPCARNVNWNSSVDRGLMQINECWDEVILSDNIMETMFCGNTNKVRRVEEFIFNIRHNIFVGCFVLKEKLSLNKTVRQGIKRYNGDGYSAELYSDAVIDIYAAICKKY